MTGHYVTHCAGLYYSRPSHQSDVFQMRVDRRDLWRRVGNSTLRHVRASLPRRTSVQVRDMPVLGLRRLP
jgi:hypothetical protein